MNVSQAKKTVAQNCFGFSPELAKLAEAEAGKAMAALCKTEPHTRMARANKSKWRTGNISPRAITANRRRAKYYDQIMFVLVDGMKTGEVRDAVHAQFKGAQLPANLGEAMLRMRDWGLLDRELDRYNNAHWFKVPVKEEDHG